MALRRLIAIGASAGGVEALTRLVHDMRRDIPAAIFVTLHFPPTGTSALARILKRAGSLIPVQASDRLPIEEHRIYIAPPDHHLLVFRDHMRLYRGPRENGNRPAVDPMFRSAALAYGPRVIGVVLSGNLDDGTSGFLAIKGRGGLAVVQDPEEAMFPSMPQSAIDHVDVDYVTKMDHMAALLYELTQRPPEGEEMVAADDTEKENEYAAIDLDRIEQVAEHPGVLAPFGCPDCGGTLWELREGSLVRFLCRVGHAWTSESLLTRQAETLDAALWTALRALEESASLSQELANRARSRGNVRVAQRLSDNAELASRRAAVVREVLARGRVPATDIQQQETSIASHTAPTSSPREKRRATGSD
jgi:two-component system chemotaxis response regulator CheB